MQDLLGDLIPKGGNVDQTNACSQQRGEMFPKRKSIFQRGENADWIESTYERRVANRGRNKVDHGFSGRPSNHCMMVSIQASVSG